MLYDDAPQTLQMTVPAWRSAELFQPNAYPNVVERAALDYVALDTPDPLEWIWPRVIPRGSLTLLAGMPGIGKSFVAIDIAARLSGGLPWPGTRPKASVPDGDLQHLESSLRAWRGVDLLVIDPVVAYLEQRESEPYLRKVLADLARLAAEYRLAVLAIAHLRSDPAKSSIYQALGSRALATIPRCIWTVLPDPARSRRRLFLPLKMNHTATPPGYRFEFGPTRLVWEDRPIHQMASDPAVTHTEHWAMDEAIDSIQSKLAAGEVPAAEVIEEASRCGLPLITLTRAKQKLKVQSYRKGFGPGGTWTWSLNSRSQVTDQHYAERGESLSSPTELEGLASQYSTTLGSAEPGVKL
ncbi:MAG: AAA family ATPase [Planctomycetales bacterium]